MKMDLSAETVAVIGQGNVAIDVARILLSPLDELKVCTYIYSYFKQWFPIFRKQILLNMH